MAYPTIEEIKGLNQQITSMSKEVSVIDGLIPKPLFEKWKSIYDVFDQLRRLHADCDFTSKDVVDFMNGFNAFTRKYDVKIFGVSEQYMDCSTEQHIDVLERRLTKSFFEGDLLGNMPTHFHDELPFKKEELPSYAMLNVYNKFGRIFDE